VCVLAWPYCTDPSDFVYDPQLGPLNLGKISAMRECARAASLATTLPRLHWYCASNKSKRS